MNVCRRKRRSLPLILPEVTCNTLQHAELLAASAAGGDLSAMQRSRGIACLRVSSATGSCNSPQNRKKRVLRLFPQKRPVSSAKEALLNGFLFGETSLAGFAPKVTFL